MKLYVRDVSLADRFGVSRSTIWRWTHEGSFPKPVSLSPRCTRWRMEDVEKWEQDRASIQATR